MAVKTEMGRFAWRESEGEVFKVLLTGDLCPRGVSSEFAPQIMKNLKGVFAAADLRVVQWECALCNDGEPIIKSGPNLKEPVDAVRFMTELGTDVALLANNHTGDFGPEKALETVGVVNAAGIATVGVGRNAAEAARPLRIERNGLRISILNFCEHEFGVAGRNSAGAAKLDPFANIAAVKAERPNADILIVAVHGGHEYNPYPSPRMIEWYRQIAGAGADLFFGCHTHTPGGVEVVDGVPIIYSPGNFYFPAREEREGSLWNVGYLTTVSFDKKGAFALEVLPCYQHREELIPFTDKLRRDFDEYLGRINCELDDPERIEDIFEAWCLKAGFNGYFKNFRRERSFENFDDRDVVKSWLAIRNLFTCEAHRDLLRKTLLLIEEFRLQDAEKHLPLIEDMQNPPWLEEMLRLRESE